MNFKVEKGYFSYSNKHILEDISFEVRSGDVLAILGSNGVGKTTLLKCMMGLYKWEKGNSFIDNVNINNMSKSNLWSTIAYVPQAKGSTFSFNVLDMVLLGRSAHIGSFSQPSKIDVEIAQSKLELLKILDLQDKQCNKISGGQLQMVLIARALAANPKLLVLDEPESNLDFKNQLIILEAICKLAKQNYSIIINTHYPQHAMKVSNKTLILNKDRSNIFGETNNILNEENMKKSFNVKVHINDFSFENEKYKSVVPISIV